MRRVLSGTSGEGGAMSWVFGSWAARYQHLKSRPLVVVLAVDDIAGILEPCPCPAGWAPGP